MDAETRSEADTLDLFIANQPRFLAFLRRHVRDEAEAEDLLQHAMLKALRHQGDWDGKENILAWFYRILRNALIDHYRSRASDVRNAEAMETYSSSILPQEDREQLCACLIGVLPSLKPGYAEVLRRVDLQEEEPTQVAVSLGVTPNNLFVRLHRARQALRKSLEKTCGVCTRHGCLDCSCGHGSQGHH